MASSSRRRDHAGDRTPPWSRKCAAAWRKTIKMAQAAVSAVLRARSPLMSERRANRHYQQFLLGDSKFILTLERVEAAANSSKLKVGILRTNKKRQHPRVNGRVQTSRLQQLAFSAARLRRARCYGRTSAIGVDKQTQTSARACRVVAVSTRGGRARVSAAVRARRCLEPPSALETPSERRSVPCLSPLDSSAAAAIGADRYAARSRRALTLQLARDGRCWAVGDCRLPIAPPCLSEGGASSAKCARATAAAFGLRLDCETRRSSPHFTASARCSTPIQCEI